MQLGRDGAEHFPDAAGRILQRLTDSLQGVPPGRAGVRLSRVHELREVLGPEGPIGNLAARFLGAKAIPVRAILFDKTADRNWGLGWHQDRTICVQTRRETPGFGPWTTKAGLLHVAPPFAYIERMLTIRVHLDAVTADNAPLLVAPGSHRLGLIPVGEVAEAVARCGSRACLAAAGDIWVYATPILHASDAANRPGRRRVLQIDYSADELPDGLDWLGVT